MAEAARSRLQQTRLRVTDLPAALRFYRDALGLQLLARRASSAFLGHKGPDAGALLELECPEGAPPLVHGSGYGHVALGVRDTAESFARATAAGAGAVLSPGVLTPGGPCCAFVSDPFGYAIELVETRAPDPGGATQFDPNRVILGPDDGQPRILHTMLRIGDVDRSLAFYIDGLGMTLFERLDVEVKGGVTTLFVGYGGDAGRLIELTWYRQQAEPFTHGSTDCRILADIADLAATTSRLERLGFTAAGSIVHDPDGHAFELSQAQ